MSSSLSSSSGPWRVFAAWAPVLQVSAALHVAAVLAFAVVPTWAMAHWAWIVGVILLDHAVVVGLGLWPRSTALGPNVLTLPAEACARREIALTLDDGPDPEVTPAVLQLLAEAGVKATFFCIGRQVQRHPDLVRAIVAAGHSVQNHSFRHDHRFSLSGPGAFEREVEAGQDAIAAVTGERPTCFRAPAGLRNPFLAPVLRRLGLHLVSWTRRGFDTRERDPARVLERLTRDLAPGDILLLHDAHSARTAQGRPVVLEVLPALLQRCRAEGLRPVTLTQALPPLSPS